MLRDKTVGTAAKCRCFLINSTGYLPADKPQGVGDRVPKYPSGCEPILNAHVNNLTDRVFCRENRLGFREFISMFHIFSYSTHRCAS